jgi:hypothetical protein
MSGKGDQRRKQDLEKYGKNYAEIFKKFKSETKPKKQKRKKKDK